MIRVIDAVIGAYVGIGVPVVILSLLLIVSIWALHHGITISEIEVISDFGMAQIRGLSCIVLLTILWPLVMYIALAAFANPDGELMAEMDHAFGYSEQQV